jgi:hypothetical protein
MLSLKDVVKGYGPSLALGVGMALLVPVILPAVAGLAKPLVKGLIKGSLTLVDTVKECTVSAGEQVSDLYAEAKAEHYGKLTK